MNPPDPEKKETPNLAGATASTPSPISQTSTPPLHPKIVFVAPPTEHKVVFNAPPVAPPPPPPPPPKEPIIPKAAPPTPTMRSYAYDIKSTVNDQGTTLATIVMAENRKLEALKLTDEDIEETKSNISIVKIALITIGIFAILGGIGALVLTYIETAPVTPQISASSESPFVRTESSVIIEVPDTLRSTMLQVINERKNDPTILVGKLSAIGLRGNDSQVISSEEFLQILQSRVPETLRRSLDPRFSLGIYGAEKNSPYFIFKTDNFDNAYAGMLEWEDTLIDDLGPLFFDKNDLPVATSTADLPPYFSDKIYSNSDARVVFNIKNEPVLLWTIVNRTYIIITATPEALREIILRMTTESIVR